MDSTIKGQDSSLDEHGFEIHRQVLPRTVVQNYRSAFLRFIDDVCCRYRDQRAGMSFNFPGEMPTRRKFAIAVGLSGGRILHQVDPVLNSKLDDFSWSNNLPSPFIPELFDLITRPEVLKSLQARLGAEIDASPIWHNHIKLPPRLLKVAERAAASVGKRLSDVPHLNFAIGATGWHRDIDYFDAEARQSDVVNVWLPLTPSTLKNGCLLVMPGSHQEPSSDFVPEGQQINRVPIEVEPGDLVLLHKGVLHGAHNRHPNQTRWAFNCRYVPHGQASGRNTLPTFQVASAESQPWKLPEYKDWADTWHDALLRESTKQ